MSSIPTVFVPDYSDLLVQLMGETDNEYAALKTLHGNFGKWEDFRYALHRSLMREHFTQPAPGDKKSWTDELLKVFATNDKRYLDFIMEGGKQATRFHDLAEKRGELATAVNQQNFGGVR